MGVLTFTTGVVTGVVSNFLFEEAKNQLGAARAHFAPSIIHGRHEPFIRKADALTFSAIKNFREKTQYEALKRYLDDPNLERNRAVQATLAEIFLGKKWQLSGLNKEIREFQDRNDQYKLENFDDQLERLRNDIKGKLLSNENVAQPLIFMAVDQIKDVLTSIPSSAEVAAAIEKTHRTKEIELYTTMYVKSWQRAVRQLRITGLDAATRREQVVNDLSSSYVPISIDQVNFDSFNPTRADAEEALEALGQVIIRGDAGSGKTTLMHKRLLDFDTRVPLGEQKASVPIYVPLRRIDKVLVPGYNLEAAINDCLLDTNLKNKQPLGWLDELQRTNRLLIMFDGVDEVRTDNRQFVWDLINDTFERFASAQFVVTSRNMSAVHLSDGSYRPDLFDTQEAYSEYLQSWRPPTAFVEFSVVPFTNIEVANFIERWFAGVDLAALPPTERNDVEHYSEQLKSQIFSPENSRSLDLARSPLLCALFCVVAFLQHGNMPKSRRELYQKTTSLLVETRDERKGVDVPTEFANFTLEFREQVLQMIALTMQEGAVAGQADQAIEVEKSLVVKWLDSWLENKVQQWSFDGKQLLTFLIDRCSIIREPGARIVDFTHRSFMEFLAAEEIAIEREPYAIRNTIFKDEWYHTLQFCMHTSEGGGHYGGLLFEAIASAIDAESSKRRKRLAYLRLLTLLRSSGPIPKMYDKAIQTAVEFVLPFSDEEEAQELKGVPARILNVALNFSETLGKYGEEQVAICAELLARHPEDETKFGLLSGYERLPDVATIRVINSFGKLSIKEHFALMRRIQNKSFTDTVVVRPEELSDERLRRGLKNIGIKFPVLGTFIGWDVLHYANSVKLINVTRADLRKMSESVKTWKFDHCRKLEIAFCNGISLGDVEQLFPAVEEIEFTRGQAVSFKGISEMQKLKAIWLIGLSQPIKIEAGRLPETLEFIWLSNSTAPIVEGELGKCELAIDDSAADRTLYSGA